MGYLLALLFTVSLGTLQFGYSIGSWNTAFAAYSKYNNWGDEATHNQTVIQTVTTLGSAIGALFAGPVASIGRWKCLIYTNIIVILGCSLTLIENWPCLCIGRFLYGVAAGSFSVFCPKYVSEVAPVEIKGPAGSLTQIMITFGILVPFALGAFFPHIDEYSDSKNLMIISMLFAIPIGISVLNIFLLVSVFNFDTPPILKQNG